MSIPMITKAERGPSLEIDLKVIFAVKHVTRVVFETIKRTRHER